MTTRTTRTDLPDGSVCIVAPITGRSSLISREVDGTIVWGQAFGTGDDHPGQIARVVASMTADPAAYRRAR